MVPVLTSRIVLSCYAKPGTDLAYGVMPCISLRACYAMPGTDAAYLPIRVLNTVRLCYTMCGTDLGQAGTDLGYAATRGRAASMRRSKSLVLCPIGLRACYAESGTDLACSHISLRACYAMSGTDIAYGSTRQYGHAHLRA
eukprot:2363480-Rhodomonas_salina.2